MAPPRICVTTLGCKVNQCDGEQIARSLAALGYDLAAAGSADLYIVNTCTVTATADVKARKLIRKLARSHPGAGVIVTGCWAQRHPAAAAAVPGVTAVVSNRHKPEIAKIVSRLLPRDGSPPAALACTRTRAFVKAQDGCDHRCAYCAVPDARGRPTSKPFAEVLEEVRRAADRGVQELVLCGVRLGAYGAEQHSGSTLAGLLHALREVPLPRLRLSSLEPMDVDAGLIREFAGHPRLCHHLHLPLQSGDDRVLAEMGRGYTTADFTRLVGLIREAWPDVALTTDVMVGFPGETEEQFQRTIHFVQEVGFSRLHVFPFAPRPDTPAAFRHDQVPSRVRRGRASRLRAVGERLVQRAAEAWVGRQVHVLFEQRARDGRLTGLTEHYLRVRCDGPSDWLGRIVSVRAERAKAGELLAAPN